MSKLYTYSARDIDGNEFSFEALRGKAVLIVNTASKCGLTPQYEGLQMLHKKYNDSGLVILGFPANDFGAQEPGTNDEIKSFCQLNYGVDFLMMEKVEVTDEKADPLYKYLITGAGNKAFEGPIQWNFAKFLFDKEGNMVDRFDPATKPEDIESRIQTLL